MRLKRARLAALFVASLSIAGGLPPLDASTTVSATPPDTVPGVVDQTLEPLKAPVIIEVADGSDLDPSDAALIEYVEDLREITANIEDQMIAEAASGAELPAHRAGSNGGIIARFDPAVPSDVRAVVNAALAQWDAALVTSSPVTVQVSWLCFNTSGLLGFAGPTTLFRDPATDSILLAALAHQVKGADLNGPRSEIEMALNAVLAGSNDCAFATDQWYVSTDDNPAPGQIDLFTVVLHEVGHGLGFFGSAQDPDEGGLLPASISNPRFSYDNFVYSGSARLIDTNNPNSQLTSNNLSFDIGGGRLHPLYAPSTFRNGSSYSHFDLAIAQGEPGVLMTPALPSSVVRRDLDAAILGLMSQQGWNVVPRAVTPTILAATPASERVTVGWDENLGGYGTAPLSYEIRAVRGGKTEAIRTVAGNINSVVLNQLTNGATYRIEIYPIDQRGLATSATQTVTLPAIPNRPKFVQSNGVGLARNITWQTPNSSGSGGSLSYTAQYRQVNSSTWVTVGSTTGTSAATGQLSDTPYQFRVRATNANGNGPYGYSTIIGASPTVSRPFPLDDQISRLFSAYYLRGPDTAGFNYWVEQRANGLPLESMSAAFEASPEFQARYGSLSDSQFVDLVYANVTGRPADATGRAFWINFLAQGNSRGSLMIGFSDSAEYVGRSGTVTPTNPGVGPIYRLYLAFFLREPDSAGLAFWVSQFNNGISLEAIAEEFVKSAEFQSQYGSLTNSRFVQLVYNNVLIREPDADGSSFWTSQLNGGASRGAVMVGFSNSPEFIIRTGSLP